MQRRNFLTLLGASAAAWPLSARAQQTVVPVVGYIGSDGLGAVAAPTSGQNVAAFRKGLAESGYVEGHNVAIEYRWVAGQNDRLPALVRELIDRGVAVLAPTTSTAAALATKAATQTIPIVFRIAGDPLAVASFHVSTGRAAMLLG